MFLNIVIDVFRHQITEWLTLFVLCMN